MSSLNNLLTEESLALGWCYCSSQSRQGAKLFSSRRNWDSPNPSPAGECAPTPPPVLGGGAHSLAREGWRVPILTRGHTLWYSLYIRILCAAAYPQMTPVLMFKDDIHIWIPSMYIYLKGEGGVVPSAPGPFQSRLLQQISRQTDRQTDIHRATAI